MNTPCDTARRHLGAVRDHDTFGSPLVDDHVAGCPECRQWLADVDDVTRALKLRTASAPTFVDRTLELWDARAHRTDTVRHTVGRIMLAVSALGCLIVGALIAADNAGHTHIGVTAQREVIILEIALALGLACAAVRPGVYLAGILPILAIVAIVNLAVSVINLVSLNSTLLAEVAHVPFLLGLVGAFLIHRSNPLFDPAEGHDGATAHV